MDLHLKPKELVRRLVVFSILMENNKGILGKAPKYILEKYYSILKVKHHEALLDQWNKRKYEEWLNIWDSP